MKKKSNRKNSKRISRRKIRISKRNSRKYTKRNSRKYLKKNSRKYRKKNKRTYRKKKSLKNKRTFVDVFYVFFPSDFKIRRKHRRKYVFSFENMKKPTFS